MKTIQVVAAVLERDGNYLIARRAHHKSLPGKWEFPGGKIESGESSEVALERELNEEFGIKTLIGKHLISTSYSYPEISIELIAFEVKYLSGDFILSDHDKIDWVKASNFRKYDFAEADIPIIDFLLSYNNL